MWNALWPLLLLLSLVVWPVWLWRRMKKVQRAARDQLDDTPEKTGARWEEVTVGDDGRGYGRADHFDPVLAKVSRDAAGVDDVKNLEGRR